MENGKEISVGRSNVEEPPHSIFDRKQKWVLIIIISTAATCKYCFGSSMVVVQVSNLGE